MKYILASMLGLLLITGAGAQDYEGGELAPVPRPPELPDPLQSGEAIEPQVTIIRKDDAIIEEYRLDGRHYMTRIIPAVGPAYYLVDRDGDGQMETRMSEIYDDFNVPQWVLFSW
ncbi:MAG: DUF2782 domain-containing protein [Gammaproteobacteria bacterium]|nr:DUF2782 domain-containing protein [Gammaproteobacteria bacterium]MCY4210022.1 DUF2782 domain-containing protein [Gammaproteobacteria bacterium]MCY4281442.1 DUF2782 domain-containing protein [Gammaproteobacteria bacterium]